MTTSPLVDSATTATTGPHPHSHSHDGVIPKYRLIVRQQPEKSRFCSFKEKGEPLDCAKVNPQSRMLPLLATNGMISSNSSIQYPYFFMYATLVTESGDEDLTFVESTRMTAGTTVQSLHRLRDCDNDEGTFFIFADISIRMEGFFRLRFTLFEIAGLYATSRCSVLSDVFQVFSPKKSTFLTRSFSEQGVRIRIRKETRANTSSSNKRRRSEGNQEYTRSTSTPATTTTSQSRHHSLPAIKSTHSIMSMKNILISPAQESTHFPPNHHRPHLSPTRVLPLPNRPLSHFTASSPITPYSQSPSFSTTPQSSTPLLEPSSSPSPPSSSIYHSKQHHHRHHRSQSDYWVSQQKHWCKYCKKYVYNNKATIQKHESGTFHKDNVERFLSDVYRKGRQDKKDAESVRRELQRIEKAALLSMGGQSSDRSGPSLGAPSVTSQPPPPPSAASARPPTSVSARHHQYSLPPPSLESLAAPNIQLQGRDEWALPQDDAMIGKWQTISTSTPKGDGGNTKKADDTATTTHDQAPEFQDDDEDQEEDLNEFKIKEKEYPLDHQPTEETAPADTTGLFKKRKLGGQKGNMAAKKRMIRKKDDA
ncbi:hypothetical protein [Absidia glauca]|uniref:Matrin-type domain-containing protein n=1 Tax=Absidia glauca TaxID=4829 RepID=A0A163KPC9_ABSGL|nr:hypothetical protein [Absidia glauca]